MGGWELVKGAVRPGGVAVLQVLGQDLAQVALVEDEQSDEYLAAQGADHALADRIRLWRLRRAEKDPDTRSGEHGVERLRELAAAVADQESGGVGVVADVHQEVAGGLGGPGAVGAGGDAGQVRAAGAVLDDN